MPSPLGHLLAGLAIGWSGEPSPPHAAPVSSASVSPLRAALPTFVAWCAVAAAIPDADLLIPHFHRTATHSLTATAIVLIIAAGVTGKVTEHRSWAFVWALAASHASHLLLDWLGVDRFTNPGIQLLWPFSDTFYISDVNLFPPVERRILRSDAFSVNLTAALTEIAVMGPIAAAAWFVRRTRRSRVRSFVPGAPRRPSA